MIDRQEMVVKEKQTSGKPKQWEWMRGSRGWVSKREEGGHADMSASINHCVCMWGEMGEIYVLCAVCREGHIQHSTSGPSGSRTWGLVASVQWLYPDDPGRGGRHTDRQTEDLHCWFMTRLLFPLPSVLTWSVLLHQPTSISKTPLTHAISPSDHTLLAVTPSLPPSFFSHSPSLGFRLLWFFSFISSLSGSSALCLSLSPVTSFAGTQVFWEKLLTEDKMLRAVVPHSLILCNRMAVGVAYWLKW